MVFTLNLSGLQATLNRLMVEEMNRRLAARIAARLAAENCPESTLEEKNAFDAAAQEEMRRFIRSIKKVIGAILTALRVLALNRLRGSRRQSPTDQSVDGLVASVPVPPTTILSCAAF